MNMLLKYSLWRIYFVFLSAIQFTPAASNYRENLPLRHSCNAINKRLEQYITWTEKLTNSQYKGRKGPCGQFGSGSICCTDEILSTYASSLNQDLNTLLDSEIIHISRVFAVAKQQTDVWTREYLAEFRRLTISSLETLFGTKEYRLNIHQFVSTLFNILGDNQSTVDDISRSTVDLLNHLIISLYRRFMSNDNNLAMDEKFAKCLINKAFDLEALSTQRELLYILTSGSTLMRVFRTMLIYIDADIERLKETIDTNADQCLQFYARESLCPLCTRASNSANPTLRDDMNELICENDCQYAIRTCFNQTNNPYIAFASIAKGYAIIVKEIEQAITELKLVERLSKLHIYFYDMVVNTTNNRYINTELRAACPNPHSKPFSPILSLPPTTNERPELVYRWNRTLHFLLKQLHSSNDNLYTHFTQQTVADICSKPKYAARSQHCTQLDQHTMNTFIHRQHSSIPETTFHKNNAELTRNQLDDLKKKLTPVQQIILSLKPKKKYSLIEYIPDFGAYDQDTDLNNDQIPPPSAPETYDNEMQDSLSDRLYKELDGSTTGRYAMTTRKPPRQATTSNVPLTTPNMRFYLILLILSQILFLDQSISL